MHKLATFAAVLAVGGCAHGPFATDEDRQLTAALVPPVQAEPVLESSAEPKQVDANELNEQTVCEQVKIPGSRIVRETRCYTPANDPEAVARNEEIVRQQIEQLRREQDAIERMQRQREMEQRNRAVIMGR